MVVVVGIGIVYPIHADEAGSTKAQLVSDGMPADQSYYSRYWPEGHPALFKLKDNLILAVPPQYQKFWLQNDQVGRAPTPLNQLALVNGVAFDFFLPRFSGYTPDNYLVKFNADKVEVVEIEAADPRQTEPDAPGSYPPNMLKRALDAFLRADDYSDKYGLRCYRNHTAENVDFLGKITCYGQRDEVSKEDIMLDVVTGTGHGLRFPQMQAEYFTRRYGGLRIVWRTNAKNLPRWHDIDAQIWKFVDAWKVSDSTSINVDPKQR